MRPAATAPGPSIGARLKSNTGQRPRAPNVNASTAGSSGDRRGRRGTARSGSLGGQRARSSAAVPAHASPTPATPPASARTQPFREQLRHQPPAAGAERGADRELPLPRRRPARAAGSRRSRTRSAAPGRPRRAARRASASSWPTPSSLIRVIVAVSPRFVFVLARPAARRSPRSRPWRLSNETPGFSRAAAWNECDVAVGILRH